MRAVVWMLLLASVLPGCLARDLDWTVEFTDPALGARALGARVSILEGGCEGEAIYDADTDDDAAPPALVAGTYGFAARARDIRCQWFAGGCTAIELPSDRDAVTVRMEAIAPERECEGSCLEGRCGPPGGVDCPPGLADCNGSAADGCEADLGALDTCGSCSPCEDFMDYCERLPSGVHECSVVCVGDSDACGEVCTDFTRDPLHCGGCDRACPVRPGADAVCADSGCGYVCLTGYADCDGRADNGCEAQGGCSG